MPDIVLHHYDFSPFAEKVRLLLGLKGLDWRSVDIPSVLPKPDLVALTGGYRLTPVLQIGADIFCDTRCIARELDRRFPDPPLVDAQSAGLATAIEAWAETDLFWPVIRYVSGTNAERVSDRLHPDRAAMRGKPVPTLDRLKAMGDANRALVDAQTPHVEAMLSHGRDYLLSERPGLADISVYHALWFLRAMPIDCSAVLDDCPSTRMWMDRIKAIGHGASKPLSSQDAIAIARAAQPADLPPSSPAAFDPPLGTRVSIRPDGYASGDTVGELVFIDRDDLALRRSAPDVGDVVVHFPRVGYALKRL